MKVLQKEQLQMFKVKFLTTISIASLLSMPALAEIMLSGAIEQGGIVIGKTNASNRVSFDGKALAVSENGDYVFGFGRDDNKAHILIVTSPNGLIEKKILTPQQRDYKIQRITGIAKKIMNPKPKDSARAKLDSSQVREARSQISTRTAFANGFIAPIKGTITGVYGSQRFFNGVRKSSHYGLDYAGKTGDPVKAPADGKVVLYVADMFYSGGTMIIDHGHGITSSFLHLSNSYVTKGEEVKQGQVVAAVGSSGRATGPHLDWRINWFQVRLDPALALKALTVK